MAIRVKHKVNVQIGETSAMKNLLFSGDDTLAEEVIDAYYRSHAGGLSVAASGTESLPTGDVSAIKGLFLKLSGEAAVTINGSDTPIQLRKATGASYCKLFIEADITSVSIENSSSSEALAGVYCVWGDTA